MTCVIKDDGKFYPQIFLEEISYVKNYVKRGWWDWCVTEDEKNKI